MTDDQIIERNNFLIYKFLDDYQNSPSPINVKFRELIPELTNKERFTHSIHKYPAKLLVHIPYFFINNTVLSKKGDEVLDPFNGTGTVYLEGLLSERNVYGADANPLARLISKVKVTNFNLDEIEQNIYKIVADSISSECMHLPEVRNCDFWFPAQNRKDLAKLLYHIKNIKKEEVREFMLVSLSSCVKKVSYADPRIAVPVKMNPERFSDVLSKQKVYDRISTIENLNVIAKFQEVALENLKRFNRLTGRISKDVKANTICSDARNLTDAENNPLLENSIQLIITSPPYAGAQKYIRSSSLNLGWTGLATVAEIRELDKKNIGRESFLKKDRTVIKTGIEKADDIIKQIAKVSLERANLVCQYILEMKDAIDEMCRVLKKDGYLVLIIGNNNVCNFEFNTQEYLSDYLIEKKLSIQFKLIDDIKSYGLMTKRNTTANIISREYILVFKK